MRLSCPSNFKLINSFKPVFSCISLILIISNPAYAQLPPTNMGQFVHQPGDNQYTAQTQSERHGAPASVAVPVAIPVSAAQTSAAYIPTPAAPKPDVSLLPVVADEPIKPAGFPPLPDRLDLPTSGAGVWTSNSGGVYQSGGIAGNGTTVLQNGISRDPQGVHQHYVHYQAGAFMPDQIVQTNPYRPSSTDYYNVNPSAKAGMRATGSVSTSVVAAETPSTQALKKMGPEPQLAADRVTKPEAPEAVTVNQSVSQDLSLPEDDFNKHYPTAIDNSSSKRASKNAGRIIGYPARMLLYSGAGMAMGAASYAAMYAVHR